MTTSTVQQLNRFVQNVILIQKSRLPSFLDNRFTEGGEVDSRTGRSLVPWSFLVLISVTGWVDPRVIVWLERLGKMKYQVTSSEIESDTFGYVAYYLNQQRCRVPLRRICPARKYTWRAPNSFMLLSCSLDPRRRRWHIPLKPPLKFKRLHDFL
jgi:hypothetical protein